MRIDFGDKFSGENRIQGTAISLLHIQMLKTEIEQDFQNQPKFFRNHLEKQEQLLEQFRNCLKFQFSLNNLLQGPKK